MLFCSKQRFQEPRVSGTVVDPRAIVIHPSGRPYVSFISVSHGGRRSRSRCSGAPFQSFEDFQRPTRSGRGMLHFRQNVASERGALEAIGRTFPGAQRAVDGTTGRASLRFPEQRSASVLLAMRVGSKAVLFCAILARGVHRF